MIELDNGSSRILQLTRRKVSELDGLLSVSGQVNVQGSLMRKQTTN